MNQKFGRLRICMVDIAATLSNALGVVCVTSPRDDADARLRRGLSMLAYSSFDFQPLEVLGERVLVARPRERMAPARLTRLLDEVGCAVGDTVVCSLPSVTPYLRGVLLEEGRGFVTDDGQAYVPGLLRLMPARRMRSVTPADSWGPAERQAFLFLLGHVGEGVTANDLRLATGMSTTSAARALRTVSASVPVGKNVLGETGRLNVWRVTDVDSFVEKGSVVFGEAERRRFWASEAEVGFLPLAGLSALSERTLLAPPRAPQRACGPRDARSIRRVDGYEYDGSLTEVIVLSYDPAPFVEDGLVDAYTMVRTVDRSDERIDAAVEEATEGCPWLRLA